MLRLADTRASVTKYWLFLIKMSGRPALNLYGYLISSARTPSVQALFGEHCCLFDDSFGEWCSGPKQKHSRRCLLLIRISLHASACSFSIETINSLCMPDSDSLNHSRNLSMSTSACKRVHLSIPPQHVDLSIAHGPVSGPGFVQMLRANVIFIKGRGALEPARLSSSSRLKLQQPRNSRTLSVTFHASQPQTSRSFSRK